jgi:glucokinase
MVSGKRLALVGDIGGTHARFAISDIDELTIDHFVVLQTKLFSSMHDALGHYLQSIPFQPQLAGFAVAGPVADQKVAMTNAPWTFSAADVASVTGAKQVHLVNDFEALARALPFLSAHDLKGIHPGKPQNDAPKVVLGPGTGFGVCGLVRTGSGWQAVAGEGGHISFGASNSLEMEVHDRLSAEHRGHVSMERVLSGRGIEAIHAVVSGNYAKPQKDRSATAIVEAALSGENSHAIETLQFFTALLARVAGDAALLFGARGGVYLGGGIPPKIVHFLDTDAFREAFANKGRMAKYLSAIPVNVITAKDAGLRGAAIALSELYPAT